MVGIKVEAFWLICPAFADELARRQAFESFQSSTMIIGVYEVLDLGFELFVETISLLVWKTK
jgi:hypothetical protein